LEETITLSPNTGGKRMLFNQTTDSAMLTSALDEFCSAQRIELFTPDHERAAMLVMTLFSNGARTSQEIVTALAVWTKREAMHAN
jgi:hypothetical protein